MPYIRKRYMRKKPTYKSRRPYNMRRRRVVRKKYGGVKYFSERIQLDNIQIPAGVATDGDVITFNYQQLGNQDPLSLIFDLFSVVSLTYEIRPINAYSFGSSPTVAPVLTYSIQENPDTWTAPNSKIAVMDSGRSKQRVLDTQRSGVIKAYQKLPITNYTAATLTTGTSGNINAVTTLDRNKNAFKWYSVGDLIAEHDTTQNVKFGALRYWVELPTGTVPAGPNPLDCAEVYLTVKYCMKQQD